ncbi:hypothetical protein [Bradyrhizobium sp. 2TAF24]|uniref:terminase small subunit-like protein n=1 Tax=Bradyrhizobium sp. 2TAF24 TaxID=3233011 RepID=UPI003F8FF40C
MHVLTSERGIGRPVRSVVRQSPVYSRPLALHVCRLLRAGQSLRTICAAPGMPGARTVRDWVAQDRDGFAARYRRVSKRKGPVSRYSERIAAQICAELAAGRPLRDICRAKGMPRHTTVLRWAWADHHCFAARYDAARALGYQRLFDDILEIADDSRDDWRPGPAGSVVHDPGAITRAELKIARRRHRLAAALPKREVGDPSCSPAMPPRDPLDAVMDEIGRRSAGLGDD